MPPIDLTGVGGWFGAQNALQDVIARTAARGAQERAQMESMMQLGLKDRAQQVSERNTALEELKNEQFQPQLGANLRLTNARAGNEENQDVNNLAQFSREQQGRVALAILNGDITANNAAAQRAFTGAQNDLNRAQQNTITGADRATRERIANRDRSSQGGRPFLTQTEDGSIVLVKPTGEIIDTGQQGKGTLGQGAAVGYFGRMRSAIEIMNKLEDNLKPTDLAIINNSPAPELLNNIGLSSEGRRYVNALRTYTEARLRKESGAAIKDSEIDLDRRQVARAIGDQPQDWEQKRALRAQTAAGIAAQAGGLYESVFREPFDYQKITGELSGRQGASGGGGQTTAAPGLVYDPVTKTLRPGGGD